MRRALLSAALATAALGVFAVVQPRGSDAHGTPADAGPAAGLRVGAVCSSDITCPEAGRPVGPVTG